MNVDFGARSVGGGQVVVRITPAGAEFLVRQFTRLLQALEKGLRDEHLFPDAYAARVTSREFRGRQGARMREEVTGAVRRVLAQCRPTEHLLLTPSEVADWFVAAGHAQTTCLTRRRRWQRPLRRNHAIVVLAAIQHHLAHEAMRAPTGVLPPVRSLTL
ncbi:hypothetical protein FHX82_003225 [Amycolatopsis bartoniae]|uniref:Uncharacterized protein n=1 Tax=Amycolatopsis bartoniae TaxID=941986 RepID=A0A8H9IZ33_9PSEU|nr:hypothetical protein [Amycolatopsis bartoniae]MBB2936171.1 hypothetical protein [Amycolatopsis bartoniae]TVT07119.1 hypothetical protein FNH07_17435 [Amycolatopsis bartoniae]GHF81052.1 hypothetical protein GCM10017566_64020 [Amycolatopsis bartoniae]